MLFGLCLGVPPSTTVSAAGGESPIHFTDVTDVAGVGYQHGFLDEASLLYELVSGGVAAGDFDRDGWIDLYAVGGDIGSNYLFRNRGDGTFEEVAEYGGVDLPLTRRSGPTFADFDGDGWLDLFTGAIERRSPILFRGTETGQFEEVTEAAQLAFPTGPYISSSFGDHDRDGDLDLFVTQWGALLDGRVLDHLWRNNGDGTFTGASSAAGVEVERDIFPTGTTAEWFWSFCGNFADINNDSWPDILLASDFGRSQVFLNDGDGTFTDVTSPVITDENGMGAAVGDYDNDGDLDWFVTSIYDPESLPSRDWGVTGNRMYRNRGDGTFEDATDDTGVRDGNWGWGACFADFDNDGHLDIFHVNGWGIGQAGTKFYGQPARLFMNNGDATFTDRAGAMGIDDRGEGRGVVCFDYDRDGDLDVFVANNNGPSRLYRNDGGNQQSYLQVKLIGLPPNTGAVGARIYVTAGGVTQMRELRAGCNYVSQDPIEAHFGLGDRAAADELRVVWPDLSASRYTDVAVNQYLVLDQLEASTPPPTATPTAPPGLTPTPTHVCTGDCNDNRQVSALELFNVTFRSVSCGGAPMAACATQPSCASGDGNGNGVISALEILHATQNSVDPLMRMECGP